jgi:hypothetical protein
LEHTGKTLFSDALRTNAELQIMHRLLHILLTFEELSPVNPAMRRYLNSAFSHSLHRLDGPFFLGMFPPQSIHTLCFLSLIFDGEQSSQNLWFPDSLSNAVEHVLQLTILLMPHLHPSASRSSLRSIACTPCPPTHCPLALRDAHHKPLANYHAASFALHPCE